MAAVIRASLLAAIAVLCACTGGSPSSPTSEAPVPSSQTAASAQTYLIQARELITAVVRAVEPSARLSTGGYSDDPPTACDPPLQQLQSYGIYRQFDAPAGQTGAALLPALQREFTARGYHLDQVGGTIAGESTFTGGDQWIGFRVIGMHDSSLVKIMLDTRCGTAERPASPATD